MQVHKDSIENTSYYYPERNAHHKQYSFFSGGNPFSTQNVRFFFIIFYHFFKKSRSSPKSIDDFFKM